MGIQLTTRSTFPVLLAALFLLTGCTKLEELRGKYEPSSEREAYVMGLEAAGIASSELATQWLAQGEEALQSTLLPELPYFEEGQLYPERVMALGYILDLKKGQTVEATGVLDGASRLFLDLYENREADGLGLRRIASADSLFVLSHEITRSGLYVLRVQPEILATGAYTLQIQTRGSIVFPVSGKDTGAIQSFFGAPRDAGRRSHHGVDIFAARGTPVVAVREGRITSTRVGGLGGKTVWLRDARGNNYYYAHLDEQLVEDGQRVAPGDTLGLVGNTGNARTTPPHLHFGIYQRGPHDPWPYLFMPGQAARKPSVDVSLYGTEVILADGTLRTSKQRSAPVIPVDSVASGVVIGASNRHYHVRLDTAQQGYIPASSIGRL